MITPHRLKLFLAAIAVAVLTACAAIGAPPPQTFNERVAAAQISVTALRSTALQLLEAGKITAADARNVQAAANAGNAAIDLAVQIDKTDPATAGAKLTSAMAVIAAVQTYLATKGAATK